MNQEDSMIAKIVLRMENRVCYLEDTLIKIQIKEREDLTTFMATFGGQSKFIQLFYEPPTDSIVNYAIISTASAVYIAPFCDIYLINDKGKTIDKFVM